MILDALNVQSDSDKTAAEEGGATERWQGVSFAEMLKTTNLRLSKSQLRAALSWSVIKSQLMNELVPCWGHSHVFLFQENKPYIQELSIKTTIISRYAFTAVYCSMLNRHAAAAEGTFQFRIPTGAFISNFTMYEQNTLASHKDPM